MSASNASEIPARSARFAATVAGASGHDLHVEGMWRPVIGMREGALRGHVLHIDVRESLGAMSSRPVNIAVLNAVDIERIDLLTAEYGFAALTEAPASGTPPMAFLPISWVSASNPRVRRKLLQIAGKAQARLRTVPIAEIYGLDSGTPASVLREAVGQLQPIFRGVLARVAPRKGRVAELTDCGLLGAAVEAGDLAESKDPEAMLRAVLALQRMGPGVMLHSLRSVAALGAARTAGARWASLDLVRCGWHVAQAAIDSLAAPQPAQ